MTDDCEAVDPLDRERITGVILCGGASRRMGRDKAELEVGGQGLLDHAIELARDTTARVVLACGAEPRYADRGLPLVLDPLPSQGPLAGLLAGLRFAAREEDASEWVLLLACDMPAARSAVQRLLTQVREGDQIVHFLRNGYPEPLCALYHRSVLGAVERALASGERRMTSFWAPLHVHALTVEDGGDSLQNVNTPADLASARASARASTQLRDPR